MTELEQFEAWVKQPPMEWDCERFSYNGAWPGSYRHYPTQCAWEGWQAARAQTAQAVPLLSDAEMRRCAEAMDAEPLAEGWTELVKFARAIEAAVRAKMGVAVPMRVGDVDGPTTRYRKWLDDTDPGIVGKEEKE